MVRRFFRVQRLDFVVLADGLVFDYPETACEAMDAPLGALCENPDQVRRLAEGLSSCNRAFAICLDGSGRGEFDCGDFTGKTYGVDSLSNESLGVLLKSLRGDFEIEGCDEPRSIAGVFGYLGMSNYANEHILASIDSRLRMRRRGSSVVALSVDPQYTLEHRGIYAIGMDDKYLIEKVVQDASVVLVIAGLVGDSGLRHSMGKAEILCNASGCDICSIAALSVLCNLNDARLVLYGGAVGPLDLADSRRLVAFMSKLDALFVSRDELSEKLIRMSGVSEGDIFNGADPAMLASFEPTQFVDDWLAERDIDLSRDKVLAVSLRSGQGFPDDFPQRVAATLKLALDRYSSLRVVLCALDPGDSGLLERVKAAVGDASRANIFHPGAREETLSDFFSRAYAGFSMQYYATLALMREGIPCMGVASQTREGALFGEVGCEELLLPADASAEDMFGALTRLLDNRDAWKDCVDEGVERIVRRAMDAESLVVDALQGATAASAFDDFCYPHVKSANDRAYEKEIAKLKAKLAQVDENRDATYRLMASREYRWGAKLVSVPRKMGLLRGEADKAKAED